MPKEKVKCRCLSITMLDSVLKAYGNYYPQTFLEECKYEKEKIKTKNYTDEELKSDRALMMKQNQIVSLMMKQNLILILMITNKFKKILQYNKSLIVCVNHALLGFYFRQSV